MRTEQDIACLEDHGFKLLTDASASGEYISRIFHWKDRPKYRMRIKYEYQYTSRKREIQLYNGKKGQ